MKNIITFIFLFNFCVSITAQEIIKLPFEKVDHLTWEGNEKVYFSEQWGAMVVTNVSIPTLQIYKPKPSLNTGTSVIIAPGGGFYALSIENEGREVAKRLNDKGITALLLKYRLVPTREDGTVEFSENFDKDSEELQREVAKMIPYSIADGLEAISYTRQHAQDLGIDENKIGFMGFSAGGAVTMGVAYHYNKKNRPDFLVPVYAWTDAIPMQIPKKEAPPMLLICASDDSLGFAPGSIELYNSWSREELNVALHMYSKGGHGFGMKKQGLPSDNWIERFYDWSVAEEITIPK